MAQQRNKMKTNEPFCGYCIFWDILSTLSLLNYYYLIKNEIK